MANTSSAKKANRVSVRKQKINSKVKVSYKQARKSVLDELKKGNIEKAEANLATAYAQIDMASKKGVIKKNTASRYKSRLASQVNKAKSTS
jgi:small subunit ribosomal protein S20